MNELFKYVAYFSTTNNFYLFKFTKNNNFANEIIFYKAELSSKK